MPTKHRRHAITETPRVKEALDPLRQELNAERLDLGELVVLGAEAKLAHLRAERPGERAKLEQLAGMIRNKQLDVDLAAAEEVRRTGWSRP